MKTKDILRKIRYILDLDEARMLAVFAEADRDVTGDQISAWLGNDDGAYDEDSADVMFATFLDGLINAMRGRKDGPRPDPAEPLNNNVVLRKLKIAFDLQADDMLSILALGDVSVSKHELSALFRRPGHKHYRECSDELLRAFLQGLQMKYREDEPPAEVRGRTRLSN